MVMRIESLVKERGMSWIRWDVRLWGTRGIARSGWFFVERGKWKEESLWGKRLFGMRMES